jgi:hypothetical protein
MDINIHTLCLSLDLGPVAFTPRGNVERREVGKDKNKLLKFYKARPLKILRVWKLNLGYERVSDRNRLQRSEIAFLNVSIF